jgi:hypothetical protein
MKRNRGKAPFSKSGTEERVSLRTRGRRTSLQDFQGGFQDSDVKRWDIMILKFTSFFRSFEGMVLILSLLPVAHPEMYMVISTSSPCRI